MKKILVATDFSECAKNAMDYAISLAQEKKMGIILMHANSLAGIEPGFVVGEGDLTNLNYKTITERIELELERVKGQQAGVEIETTVYIGDVVDGLKERTENGDIFLTLMGTTGENSSGIIWGSKSMNAMRGHNGPILIIPPTATYKNVEKLMLSMDIEKVSSKFPYDEVKAWVKEMDATLDILNVEPLDPFAVEDNSDILENFKEITYQFKALESETLSDAISFYLEKYPVDWIVVIPRKYNFFENLFLKSKSEIISKASTVPILALHPE